MKQIFITSLILFALKATSQNDTIFLKSDHLVLKGEVYNKTNENEEKIGNWINYEFKSIMPLLVENASGYDIESGMDCHWETYGTYVYRALNIGEKEETRITKKKSCDTIRGSIYYSITADIIRSKIAPDAYFISSEGSYKNGKKSSLWKYYYETGTELKRIEYLNGFPIESYSIYRKDGSVMIHVEKQKDSKWLVSKYSKSGKKFEEKSGSIEDFKGLY
ncbi:hypothetical protein [Carboxylicivirga marina]|uniref:hypothetical protein n=1 Tax=Carboxylicivirga marina TaxID=2800988 RepID=UPI002593016B|nr:hypothetical protein [uncultured Carboxylicivirga sp.]